MMSQVVKSLKKAWNIRWLILKAHTLGNLRAETAYWLSNWGGVLSTIIYTVVQVALIDLLYRNTATIAGYTKDQMLIFGLFSQFSFYFLYSLLVPGLQYLNESVRSGQLDLLLTKPSPTLFLITFHKLRVVTLLKDAPIPLLIITLSINWSNISAGLFNTIVSIVALFVGIYGIHVFQFVLSLTVFWDTTTGKLAQMYFIIEDFGRQIPLEGYPVPIRLILTTIIPISISTGLALSVLFDRIPLLPTLFFLIIFFFILITTKVLMWNYAIRHYSSASS